MEPTHDVRLKHRTCRAVEQQRRRPPHHHETPVRPARPGNSSGFAAEFDRRGSRVRRPAVAGDDDVQPDDSVDRHRDGVPQHRRYGGLGEAGVKFSLRWLLRGAIILLGLQLTANQVIEIGGRGLGIIVTTLLATFAFTVWMGNRLGVEPKLAQLIAAGTSICGASAVIATNTVTDAHDEDVAYAVACVTVFGSVAMFGYPLLPGLLHLDPHAFGLWTGASIH